MSGQTVLEKGETAPDFELRNFNGESVALSDLDNFDGVLVIFMCNHCPYVQAEVEEIRRLDDRFSSIAIVGINPNSETHPMDSYEKMSEFVDEKGLESSNFYYLEDPDQEVAERFGAECTPDPFLLDWRHRLYYHGKLDDSKPGTEEDAENFFMEEAIQKMLKRQEPPEQGDKPVGCSIKWKE